MVHSAAGDTDCHSTKAHEYESFCEENEYDRDASSVNDVPPPPGEPSVRPAWLLPLVVRPPLRLDAVFVQTVDVAPALAVGLHAHSTLKHTTAVAELHPSKTLSANL